MDDKIYQELKSIWTFFKLILGCSENNGKFSTFTLLEINLKFSAHQYY